MDNVQNQSLESSSSPSQIHNDISTNLFDEVEQLRIEVETLREKNDLLADESNRKIKEWEESVIAHRELLTTALNQREIVQREYEALFLAHASLDEISSQIEFLKTEQRLKLQVLNEIDSDSVEASNIKEELELLSEKLASYSRALQSHNSQRKKIEHSFLSLKRVKSEPFIMPTHTQGHFSFEQDRYSLNQINEHCNESLGQLSYGSTADIESKPLKKQVNMLDEQAHPDYIFNQQSEKIKYLQEQCATLIQDNDMLKSLHQNASTSVDQPLISQPKVLDIQNINQLQLLLNDFEQRLIAEAQAINPQWIKTNISKSDLVKPLESLKYGISRLLKALSSSTMRDYSHLENNFSIDQEPAIEIVPCSSKISTDLNDRSTNLKMKLAADVIYYQVENLKRSHQNELDQIYQKVGQLDQRLQVVSKLQLVQEKSTYLDYDYSVDGDRIASLESLPIDERPDAMHLVTHLADGNALATSLNHHLSLVEQPLHHVPIEISSGENDSLFSYQKKGGYLSYMQVQETAQDNYSGWDSISFDEDYQSQFEHSQMDQRRSTNRSKSPPIRSLVHSDQFVDLQVEQITDPISIPNLTEIEEGSFNANLDHQDDHLSPADNRQNQFNLEASQQVISAPKFDQKDQLLISSKEISSLASENIKSNIQVSHALVDQEIRQEQPNHIPEPIQIQPYQDEIARLESENQKLVSQVNMLNVKISQLEELSRSQKGKIETALIGNHNLILSDPHNLFLSNEDISNIFPETLSQASDVIDIEDFNDQFESKQEDKLSHTSGWDHSPLLDLSLESKTQVDSLNYINTSQIRQKWVRNDSDISHLLNLGESEFLSGPSSFQESSSPSHLDRELSASRQQLLQSQQECIKLENTLHHCEYEIDLLRTKISDLENDQVQQPSSLLPPETLAGSGTWSDQENMWGNVNDQICYVDDKPTIEVEESLDSKIYREEYSELQKLIQDQEEALSTERKNFMKSLQHTELLQDEIKQLEQTDKLGRLEYQDLSNDFLSLKHKLQVKQYHLETCEILCNENLEELRRLRAEPEFASEKIKSLNDERDLLKIEIDLLKQKLANAESQITTLHNRDVKGQEQCKREQEEENTRKTIEMFTERIESFLAQVESILLNGKQLKFNISDLCEKHSTLHESLSSQLDTVQEEIEQIICKKMADIQDSVILKMTDLCHASNGNLTYWIKNHLGEPFKDLCMNDNQFDAKWVREQLEPTLETLVLTSSDLKMFADEIQTTVENLASVSLSSTEKGHFNERDQSLVDRLQIELKELHQTLVEKLTSSCFEWYQQLTIRDEDFVKSIRSILEHQFKSSITALDDILNRTQHNITQLDLLQQDKLKEEYQAAQNRIENLVRELEQNQVLLNDTRLELSHSQNNVKYLEDGRELLAQQSTQIEILYQKQFDNSKAMQIDLLETVRHLEDENKHLRERLERYMNEHSNYIESQMEKQLISQREHIKLSLRNETFEKNQQDVSWIKDQLLQQQRIIEKLVHENDILIKSTLDKISPMYRLGNGFRNDD